MAGALSPIGGVVLEYIHFLPSMLVLGVTVLLFGGAAFAAPFAGRRLLGLKDNRTRDAAVFDAFLAVMAMAGVVLAFSLVQADGNLRADQADVGREASAIIATDRALSRIGLPDAQTARGLLAAFTHSQLREEWPALDEKGRSPATDRRYADVSTFVAGLEPQSPRQQVIFAELMKGMDDISATREALISDAHVHLPGIFWVVSVGFVLLGLVLAALSDDSLTRAAALGLTMGGIGLLSAFVLVVDHPFAGESGLEPAALEQVLTANR